MGIVSLSLSQSNNMKFLLVLAVAAYVKAEADPAFVYSTAGVIPHVLPYAHVAYPYVHAAPLAAGCTNNDGALVPCAHGLVAPVVAAAAAPAAAEAEAVETVAKREAEPVAEATAEADAEADPEADPWLYYSGLYGHGYGYHGYAPFAYSYAPYTYSHVYSHYGLPYAYYGKRSADAEGMPLVKREAEPVAEANAEADPEADPWLYYSGVWGGHYGYAAHHYAPFAYSYAPPH